MASQLDIFNRALSRIGIDQFVGDPNETSKGGTMYRIWYDACRQAVLRDFPWPFAQQLVALAPINGNPQPGWQYAYAYPVNCLQALDVCDQNGARTTLTGVYYGDAFFDPYQAWYPAVGRRRMPFVVMSMQTSPTAVQRILCTGMVNAYLLYTADITDPTQFDSGFQDALAWKIASEIASTFLGAPVGPQVAAQCGKYYRDAVLTARAQALNESAADIRPDSPAITVRA